MSCDLDCVNFRKQIMGELIKSLPAPRSLSHFGEHLSAISLRVLFSSLEKVESASKWARMEKMNCWLWSERRWRKQEEDGWTPSSPKVQPLSLVRPENAEENGKGRTEHVERRSKGGTKTLQRISQINQITIKHIPSLFLMTDCEAKSNSSIIHHTSFQHFKPISH